jgi:hypothetical protein
MGEYPIEEAKQMITLGSVLVPLLVVFGSLIVVSAALTALIAIAPRLTTRPLRKDLDMLAAGQRRADGNVPTAV